MFRLLIERKFPKFILSLLLNLYTKQKVRVGWNGCNYSDNFSVTNGVRQGGVLSPILFTVYLDGLLTLLCKSGVGCYIGKMFVGALAYADDITIIAPTLYACRVLLRLCEKFASEYDIQFNVEKSYVIAHTTENMPIPIKLYLNYRLLLVVDWLKHLGHVINSKLNDVSEVEA